MPCSSMQCNAVRFITIQHAMQFYAMRCTAMQCDDWGWPESLEEALNKLAAGSQFIVPEVLFQKISDEECENWQSQFSGSRSKGD